MKIFRPLILALAALMILLTACNNKAANEPASANPLTWGDQTLAQTTEEKCVNRALSFTIDGTTYPCPTTTTTSNAASTATANLIPQPTATPQALPTNAHQPTEASANTTTSNVESPSGLPAGIRLVGNAYYDPCANGANPELQIEELWENGAMVPNAYTGLDLNRAEVGSGLRYGLSAPTGSYVHTFTAVNDTFPVGDHYTYEVHGPAHVINTAYTIWCAAGNWDEKLAGQARLIDAKNIPAALLAQAKDLWMTMPASGLLPVPADWLK